MAEYIERSEWIPVTERLPDAHKYVLCSDSKGGQFIGRIVATHSDGRAIAFVNGGNAILITHWMPLPEPPKDRNNGKMPEM